MNSHTRRLVIAGSVSVALAAVAASAAVAQDSSASPDASNVKIALVVK